MNGNQNERNTNQAIPPNSQRKSIRLFHLRLDTSSNK